MNSRKIESYKRSEAALFTEYQVKPEQHTISINSHGINIRVQTVGTGEPLLFIHGGPNAGATWTELASKLPEYKCILLDRPGCGLSDSVSYKDLSNASLTDLIVSVIESVLNHFQIDKISIVGSSFGGYWMLKYALEKPDRLNKLVLEGCPAIVEGMVVPQFMKMMTAPVLRWLIPKLPTSKSYSEKIMKDIGHTYSIENNLLSDVFMDWYVDLCNQTNTMKNDIGAINRTIPGGKLDPEYVITDDDIQKITLPILWLLGENDPFGAMDIGNRLNSKMDNSTLICFENSGHLPWLDNPKDHAAEIPKFLVG